MACEMCMYQMLCRKTNPKVGDSREEIKEAQGYFFKHILPFLVNQIAASGDKVALRNCILTPDLIHWEQRSKGYEECFETNYAVI